MRQSSVIFAALIVGFLVFITIRGELTGYLQVLGIAPGGAAPPASASGSTGTQTTSGFSFNIPGITFP